MGRGAWKIFGSWKDRGASAPQSPMVNCMKIFLDIGLAFSLSHLNHFYSQESNDSFSKQNLNKNSQVFSDTMKTFEKQNIQSFRKKKVISFVCRYTVNSID